MEAVDMTLLPEAMLIRQIYWIRGNKVLIDFDLAELYGISTKVLKQAVRRNIQRFPEDFMFELIKQEFEYLRSQFVTSSWGGVRYIPLPHFSDKI
jgi:hypothetical protein